MKKVEEDVVFSPQFFLVESDVSEVYRSGFNPNFNVRSKLFKKDFVTDAYTNKMVIDEGGWVVFDIEWSDGRTKTIGKPLHRIVNGVLYTMKRNKQRKADAFALNHELFSLEWDSSVILHFSDDEPFVFLASRGEWLVNGKAGHRNQEVQVFMETPDYRRMMVSMMPDGGKEWLFKCVAWNGKNK